MKKYTYSQFVSRFSSLKSIFLGVVMIASTLVIPTAVFAQSMPLVSPAQPIQPSWSTAGCLSLSYNLYYGLSDAYTGGQVSKLQAFLRSQGYYSYGTITGFYGSITAAAAVRYQQAHGISGTGYVGPLTRASIQNTTCVATNPITTPIVGTPILNYLTPSSGTVGSSVTIIGSGFAPTGNTVNFNGAVIPYVASINGTTLAFTVPAATSGTYNVSVQNVNGISNTLSYAVQGGIANPAVPYISYISPTYGPTGTIITLYGSGFTTDNNIKFDIGGVSHVAASNGGTMLTFTVPTYLGYMCGYSQPNCIMPMIAKVVSNGTYSMSVENSIGLSNSVNFIVTGSSVVPPPITPPANQPPIINGVSGPTQLSVNQVGTWSIAASSPSGNQLSYRVSWGDQNIYAAASNASYILNQNTTFTHSYAQSGTYTVVFTVTDSSGATAQSTMTVNVGSGTLYQY